MGNMLQATVTYSGSTCTYQGPQVVPSGSSLAVSFSTTRGVGQSALAFAPARSGMTWDDVLKAEAHPANSVPLLFSLSDAWPTLPILVPKTRFEVQIRPGTYTFLLNPVLQGATPYDSYLVVCSAYDVDHPSAATLIRLETP